MKDASNLSNPRLPLQPLVETHRIEGTPVLDGRGHHIGTIDRLVIQQMTGQVYAVARVGGILGVGARLYTIPWESLQYNTAFHTFGIEMTVMELQATQVRLNDYDREMGLAEYMIHTPCGIY